MSSIYVYNLTFQNSELTSQKNYKRIYKDINVWYSIGADTTQAKVNNETVWLIVDGVLEGYNGIMDEWMDW